MDRGLRYNSSSMFFVLSILAFPSEHRKLEMKTNLTDSNSFVMGELEVRHNATRHYATATICNTTLCNRDKMQHDTMQHECQNAT